MLIIAKRWHVDNEPNLKPQTFLILPRQGQHCLGENMLQVIRQ